MPRHRHYHMEYSSSDEEEYTSNSDSSSNDEEEDDHHKDTKVTVNTYTIIDPELRRFHAANQTNQTPTAPTVIKIRPHMADTVHEICDQRSTSDRQKVLANFRQQHLEPLTSFSNIQRQNNNNTNPIHLDKHPVIDHAKTSMKTLATNMARDLFVRILTDAVDVGIIDKNKAMEIGTNAEMAIETLDGNVNSEMSSQLVAIGMYNNEIAMDEQKLQSLQTQYVSMAQAISSYRQAIESMDTAGAAQPSDDMKLNNELRRTTLQSIGSQQAQLESKIIQLKDKVKIARARFFEAKQKNITIDHTLSNLSTVVAKHFGTFVNDLQSSVLPDINTKSFMSPTMYDNAKNTLYAPPTNMQRQPLISSYQTQLDEGLAHIIAEAVRRAQ